MYLVVTTHNNYTAKKQYYRVMHFFPGLSIEVKYTQTLQYSDTKVKGKSKKKNRSWVLLHLTIFSISLFKYIFSQLFIQCVPKISFLCLNIFLTDYYYIFNTTALQQVLRFGNFYFIVLFFFNREPLFTITSGEEKIFDFWRTIL